MEKLFMIGICERNTQLEKAEIHSVSDSIADLLGQKYNRVSVIYSTPRKPRTYYVSQFSKLELDMNNWREISFSFLPPKTSWFNGFHFLLEYWKYENRYYIILSALYESIEYDYFIEKISAIREAIGALFEIQWLAADTMPQSKCVELFANGLLTESLSGNEKKIAHLIQLAQHKHFKLPHLFLYNYISYCDSSMTLHGKADTQAVKGVTLVYPELFGCGLDDYNKNEEWSADYKLLKDNGVIVTEYKRSV